MHDAFLLDSAWIALGVEIHHVLIIRTLIDNVSSDQAYAQLVGFIHEVIVCSPARKTVLQSL